MSNKTKAIALAAASTACLAVLVIEVRRVKRGTQQVVECNDARLKNIEAILSN